MRKITLDDIEDLAAGAVVLGTGGGGDPYVAKLMLQQAIERYGPVPVVDAADLDPDGLILPVAMVGAPTVAVEKFLNGSEATRVLDAMQERVGKPAVAVMPFEVGGMNTLYPVAVAAELGLPVVDADSMRRAFPAIEMTVFTLAGIPASPMTLSDVKGNYVLCETIDNDMAEKLIRACTAQMGMISVMVGYSLTARQCAESAINGSLSYCLEIGRRVRAIGAGDAGAYEAFLEFCAAQILFTGKVVDIERRTVEGWARGTVTLEHLDDPTRVMRVEIQNENLIAFEDGEPKVTVPDLITLIDVETGMAMTTEGLAYGQRLHLIAMPAHERWRTPEGIALAGPRKFGYDIDYLPLVVAR
ncbi:DUF917 domain-containing protein [Amycolatopsis sp. NBC_01480]|uniref:DUF917 domain-containing protein n=1 Tax=Amycolatopsis sp. NBC_01480 TaxID=2903562 RepID=UPI002E2C0BBC|nr:DUF917 domain-containing protein [Amycolatopsis sp. NBC_01480]